MMTELTEQQYADAIPHWCSRRTLQQHIDMMLCWSLVQYAERAQAKPEHTCRLCDLYRAVGVPDG
jgi:hypothetical protein